MSEHSPIEWTEATWNPVYGCTKVSPGCAHCYIERTPPYRMRGAKFIKGRIPVSLMPSRLEEPLRWKTPRRVFVNSLSDLFHQDVPGTFIAQVWSVMAKTPQHTYQILTKRAGRMCATLHGLGVVLPNVWLGVSVENQRMADERIPVLLQTPAAKRFISAEPLLERLSLAPWLFPEGLDWAGRYPCGLDWVIVGAESGPNPRPFSCAWAEVAIRDCQAFGVPCFVKQLGKRPIIDASLIDGLCVVTTLTLRDAKGGDPTEWPARLRVREYPT